MERFKYWDLPIHNYDQKYIESLSDKELVDLLNTCDWDFDLMRELLWRAHRDDPDWTSTSDGYDAIIELQDAAKSLGQELLYHTHILMDGGVKDA